MQTIEETQPEFAVAIVMEVETGDIKAMSNLSRLPGGEYVETVNNAVQGYEPGTNKQTIIKHFPVSSTQPSKMVRSPLSTRSMLG